MDVLTKEQRSYNMSSIRGTNTRPELALRRLLHAKGLRYRCDYRVGRYSVDIAFPSRKIAVMVDGCFWHCCPNCFRMPETNVSYWRRRFRENKLRDKRATKALEKNGWVVLRVWEHKIRYDVNAVALSVVRDYAKKKALKRVRKTGLVHMFQSVRS